MDNLPPDYQEQEKQNEEQLRALLSAGRPDIFALMSVIDQTGINWKILFHVLHAIGQIANDTKYGTVNILIEDNIVRFIRGEHANKINESIFNTTDIPNSNLTNKI